MGGTTVTDTHSMPRSSVFASATQLLRSPVSQPAPTARSVAPIQPAAATMNLWQPTSSSSSAPHQPPATIHSPIAPNQANSLPSLGAGSQGSLGWGANHHQLVSPFEAAPHAVHQPNLDLRSRQLPGAIQPNPGVQHQWLGQQQNPNLAGGHRTHQWSLRFDGGSNGVDAAD